MIRNCFALAILSAYLFACTPLSHHSVEKLPSIENNNRKSIEIIRERELTAFNSGDVQGFIEIVTDDIVFDSPNRSPAIGKEAIASLCKASFNRFDFEATYSVVELIIEENFAFDRGIWIEKRTHKDSGQMNETSFGMLQIYRRQIDGSWKLARSIWNMK